MNNVNPIPLKEEGKIPVPYSFIADTRHFHSEMLKNQQAIKDEAVRKGHTGLAVKATNIQKTIRKMIRLFEEMAAEDFDILPDKEYAAKYPDAPLPFGHH